MLAQTPGFSPSDVLGMMIGALWPLFVVLGLMFVAAIGLAIYRYRRLSKAGMPEIDRMTGREFEEKVRLVLRAEGFQVNLTPYVGDWGADLVVERDGRKRVVQAKRWSRRLNPRAIQEVVASKAKYGCEEAMVITNSDFTSAARELARVNKVELWDRLKLTNELLSLKSHTTTVASLNAVPSGTSRPWPEELPRAAEPKEPTDEPTPKCYKCGRPMALKQNARGKFWACTGFPACRNTFSYRTR